MIELYTIVAEFLHIGFLLLGALTGIFWAYALASF